MEKEETSDGMLVHSFGVGHGDCTLVEYCQGDKVVWRLLYDAGEKLPEALVNHLTRVRRSGADPDIDVAVLSHVDGDHQGGFHELFKSSGFKVGEFWAPCLPAFRRLNWLFEKRVGNAVERAAELEVACLSGGTPVIYPMENYAVSPVRGRVTVSVISPPARLLHRLLVANGDDIGALLETTPLPLEWLISGERTQGDEAPALSMESMFAERTFLAPDDFKGSLPHFPRLDQKLVQEVVRERQGGAEPEFFGNSVLNDTSLVLAIDVWLDGRCRRRLLLAGDQENWVYIASKHPAGLGVDILKAPHHGGQVYLADRAESKDYAVEQMYLWLRPRSAFVSASGRHGLPHNRFRDAIRAVGATLICPNTRSVEPLTSGPPVEGKSCFASYGCGSGQRPHTVITVKADREVVNAPSCVQGTLHRGAAPIVVLQQRLVEPDEGFVRWTRAELEKNAKWVKKQLDEQHEEFKKAVRSSEEPLLAAFGRKPVDWRLIEAQARVAGRHQLVAGRDAVTKFGRSHRLFWVSKHMEALYRFPQKDELSEVIAWLCGMPHILMRVEKADLEKFELLGQSEMLRAANWEALCAIVAGKLHAPAELVWEEVQPLLIDKLVKQYSIRYCSADKPEDFPRDNGAMYIHLYRHLTPVVDVGSEQWCDELWSKKLGEEMLRFMLDQARSSFFAPFTLSLTGFNAGANKEDLTKFKPEYLLRNGGLESGDFPEFFKSAKWIDHWNSG